MRTRLFLCAVLFVLAVIPAASAQQQGPMPAEAQNCLKDAAVGEWVLYRINGGMGGMEFKQTVTAVTETAITIKHETRMNGQTLVTQEQTVPRVAKPEEGLEAAPAVTPEVTTAKEEIVIKGKTLACTVVTLTSEGQTVKCYVSNDLPVMGLVKTQAGAMVTMEAVDFGKGGE